MAQKKSDTEISSDIGKLLAELAKSEKNAAIKKSLAKWSASTGDSPARLAALSELSQAAADRVVSGMLTQESRVKTSIASIANIEKNDPYRELITEIFHRLQTIYYNSTKIDPKLFGDNKIQKTFIVEIDEIIDKVKTDSIFKDPVLVKSKVSDEILKFANKIKTELQQRITFKNKLKETVKSKFDLGFEKGGRLDEANPLLGAIVRGFKSLKGTKGPNSYVRDAEKQARNAEFQVPLNAVTASKEERNKKVAEIKASRAAARDQKTATRVNTSYENIGISPILTAEGKTQAAVTPGDAGLVGVGGGFLSAAVSGSVGDSGPEIIKILSQHTSLLGKIFGVNSQMLKLQQDKMAKDAAAAEESGLETQGGGKERAGLLPTATKEEEEQGGGGFMGLAMNLLSSRFPSVARLFPSVARLGDRLLRSGARLGGRLAKLVGLGASAGATATAVASSSADDIAKTATKAIGTETAEAATKTLGKKAAETGAKKGISASIKGLIKKKVSSTIGKIVGKGIPGLGWLIGGGFAISRLWKGDVVGAGLELGASAGSLLTSIPLTIVSLTRDIYTELYGTPPEIDPEAAPRLGEVKTGVTEAVDEELEKLGLKEKKKDDAVIQKSEQDLESAKAETPPPTGGETTPTATEAPPAPSSAPPAAGPAGGPAPTPITPSAAAPPPPQQSGGGFWGRLGGVAKSAAKTAWKYSLPGMAVAGAQWSASKLTGTATNNPSEVLEFGGESGQLQNFQGLHPVIQNKVLAAGQEYLQKTKKKLKVNSAKRYPAKQQQLWDESVKAGRPGRGPSGMAIARPGRSRHERGLAIDIQNYRDPIALAALNRQGLFQGVPGDPVHFQLDGNPSLDQPVSPAEAATDTGASQSTGAATQAPPNVAETGGGNAGSAPPAPTTASASSDTAAAGRVSITKSIAAPTAAPAGGGGGNVTNIMQGGSTIASGGGGGSASTPIPAPIDREPTLRRILDGALT